MTKVKPTYNSALSFLNDPIPNHGLSLFRIFFGAILLWDIYRIWSIDLIASFHPRGIVFPYTFLNLPLVKESLVNVVLGLLALSCIFIILGVFYRIAIITFTLLFSYVFFLDQTLYNNHLYLVILVSLIMIFLPANKSLNLKKWNANSTIPRWTLLILKFQFVVVYFYGGISKLNSFWINGHPVQEILLSKSVKSGLSFLQDPSMVYFLTYGGLFFDLFIGLFLLINATRKWAIIGSILFGLSNAYLFDDIYIFPFFMMASLIIFVDQFRLAERLNKAFKKEVNAYKNQRAESFSLKKKIIPIFIIYMLIQIILPLRHLLIDGYTDWTGDAQQFSWRMKIQHRKINTLEFSFIDVDKKLIYPVDLKAHLFPDEISNMALRPEMMVLFAKYLEDRVVKRNNISNYKIICNSNIDFNGLKSMSIFPSDLDLCGVPLNVKMNKWVSSLPR